MKLRKRSYFQILGEACLGGLMCYGSNLPQFALNSRSVENVLFRDQFRHEQHVDDKRIQTGNMFLSFSVGPDEVGIADFLLPGLNGSVYGELSKVTPVVKASINDEQNPSRDHAAESKQETQRGKSVSDQIKDIHLMIFLLGGFFFFGNFVPLMVVLWRNRSF